MQMLDAHGSKCPLLVVSLPSSSSFSLTSPHLLSPELLTATPGSGYPLPPKYDDPVPGPGPASSPTGGNNGLVVDAVDEIVGTDLALSARRRSEGGTGTAACPFVGDDPEAGAALFRRACWPLLVSPPPTLRDSIGDGGCVCDSGIAGRECLCVCP